MKLRSLLVLAGLAAGSLPFAASTTAFAATRPVPSGPNASTPVRLLSSHVRIAGSPATSPYDRGVQALHSGRYAEAAKAFTTAIARHDHSTDAYAGLGEADLAQREYAPALKAYKVAAARAPKNAYYQYRTAYAALYANDYHAAVQYATNYIHLRPSDPSGYHLRFLAYGGLQDRHNQAKDAKVVARLQPRSASAQNDLGIALANNGKYGDAEAAFTRAIRLDPTNGLYYRNRGVTESLDKKYSLAIQDLKKARSLAKDPTTRKNLEIVIAALEKQAHH